MNQEEMKKEFISLYNVMANSKDVSYMRIFGNVHKEMMYWMIANKPELALDWLEKLKSIKWKNYLTPKEADIIISKMEPKAPWTREQWQSAMEQHEFDTEYEPCYNSCALYVTMNMIMSDSSETLTKYVEGDSLFDLVYDLAVDKLTDEDGNFQIRNYFKV